MFNRQDIWGCSVSCRMHAQKSPQLWLSNVPSCNAREYRKSNEAWDPMKPQIDTELSPWDKTQENWWYLANFTCNQLDYYDMGSLCLVVVKYSQIQMQRRMPVSRCLFGWYTSSATINLMLSLKKKRFSREHTNVPPHLPPTLSLSPLVICWSEAEQSHQGQEAAVILEQVLPSTCMLCIHQ